MAFREDLPVFFADFAQPVVFGMRQTDGILDTVDQVAEESDGGTPLRVRARHQVLTIPAGALGDVPLDVELYVSSERYVVRDHGLADSSFQQLILVKVSNL